MRPETSPTLLLRDAAASTQGHDRPSPHSRRPVYRASVHRLYDRLHAVADPPDRHCASKVAAVRDPVEASGQIQGLGHRTDLLRLRLRLLLHRRVGHGLRDEAAGEGRCWRRQLAEEACYWDAMAAADPARYRWYCALLWCCGGESNERRRVRREGRL